MRRKLIPRLGNPGEFRSLGAPAAGSLYVEPAAIETFARDAWEGWHRAAARTLALLLHAAILAFLLIGPLTERPPAEPPAIPVELVMVPPPKPKPEPKPRPVPEPPPLEHHESGGSPDLAPGRPPEATAPKSTKQPAEAQQPPKPQPTPALRQKVKTQEPAPALKLPPTIDKTAPQVASRPPSAPSKSQKAAPEAAPPVQASAPARIESPLRGAGGGDRYLNAMRDEIVSSIIYPAAARGVAGVAKYKMIVSRQGYVLRLSLLQTSGSVAIDRAGMDAIQNSAPFQPLPQNIPGDLAVIEVILYIGP